MTLGRRVWSDAWTGDPLRNGRAPASDLESTYSTEEIIYLFFFFSIPVFLCGANHRLF